MNLSRLESETIISFNEQDHTADIQTYNGALKRKLSSLCEARPDEAKHKRTDEYGGMYFTVPKKWIKVNATRILSESERTRLSEVGKRLKINSDVRIVSNNKLSTAKFDSDGYLLPPNTSTLIRPINVE